MGNEGIVFVMYDLPMEDLVQKREYRKFTKIMKKNAYRRLQESVYIKHIRNLNTVSEEMKRLYKESPLEGSVIAFSMTMNQYKAMHVIRGEDIPCLNQFKEIMVI